jgi:hypothetical protein
MLINKIDLNLKLHWSIREVVEIKCIKKVNSIITPDRVNCLAIQRSVAKYLDSI